mmetsp:Transcript_83775/g.130702  ORF Transcript_83775/g.130702 Transcript_83775/m.130702 type:complete len:748 (+) Transcript_83775:110-2353(+)
MAAQRRPPRSVAEAKAPRRDLDLNKERLIFCLSSLIGHKVTVKLRGNVIYEGVFHSCALEGDFSIILKHARLLPSEQQKSGNVIETLIIPGKDFLQVNAMDVATPDSEEEARVQGGAFATDGEIIGKRGVAGEEARELVAWSPGGEDTGHDIGGLDSHSGSSNWDQFKVNEEKFGVASTFNEEYYTTKLDPNQISREKREMAERIAKEIENETKHADTEDRIDGDDDEEARFSAVQGTGAYAGKGGKGASSLTGSSSAAPSSKARGAPPGRGDSTSEALSLPVPKAGTEQVDALSGLQRDYRKQRSMVLTHSPMHSSMISEMKRINALNLEPAVPKLDDKTGSDWINFKQSQQSRNKAAPIQGDGLKFEFEQALADIKKKEGEKKNKELAANHPSEAEALSRKPEAGNATGSESTRSSTFKFNPNATSFSFNTSAAVFTPGMTPTNASATVTPSGGQGPNSQGAVAAQQNQTKIAMGPGPQFNPFTTNVELLNKKLADILDGFFDGSCTRENPQVEPTWTDATGPSFKDILGPPNPQLPMQMPMTQFGGMGNAQPAPWQQPQIAGQMSGPGGPPPPGQPGAPQMMTQPGAFMMPQPGPGGQPQQMQFSGPMYPAPTGAPMQRPPAGNMPPQGQQPMAFQQGGMVQQPGGGPQMPMHQGAPNQGAVNMQNMPKHMMPGNMPGMVMMVPAGQVPQGFAPVQMQGQPGQPMQGQPGPQGGNPQGGPMMRPMYMAPGQMGGPPHQMPSHDG